MKRLIARDNTTAAEDFRKCLATRMDTFNEYASAIAELWYLKHPHQSVPAPW